MSTKSTSDSATSGAPADSGPCASCGARNSHAARRCHACFQLLPWASEPPPKVKAAPVKAAPVKAPLKPATTKAEWVKPSAGINGSFWCVAIFSFLIPIIGFVLFRSYSENGSEKATAAGIGAALGVLFYLIRFFLRATGNNF